MSLWPLMLGAPPDFPSPMLAIGLLLISMSAHPYVHPSTATGCSFDTGASLNERVVQVAAGQPVERRMTRRCRRIREIQLWAEARRPTLIPSFGQSALGQASDGQARHYGVKPSDLRNQR